MRNKSGAIILSASDGLSSLKTYYSGEAVIKDDGADVFFLMVSDEDSNVQKNTSSYMPFFTTNPLEETYTNILVFSFSLASQIFQF